jgi:tRNA-dihydrouridine synthase 2
MFARGAQDNVSIFRKEGPLPVRHIIKEYFDLAVQYNMPYSNAKYTIMQMKYPEIFSKEFHRRIAQSKSYEQMRYDSLVS